MCSTTYREHIALPSKTAQPKLCRPESTRRKIPQGSAWRRTGCSTRAYYAFSAMSATNRWRINYDEGSDINDTRFWPAVHHCRARAEPNPPRRNSTSLPSTEATAQRLASPWATSPRQLQVMSLGILRRLFPRIRWVHIDALHRIARHVLDLCSQRAPLLAIL
jgi:hypothetical protein